MQHPCWVVYSYLSFLYSYLGALQRFLSQMNYIRFKLEACLQAALLWQLSNCNWWRVLGKSDFGSLCVICIMYAIVTCLDYARLHVHILILMITAIASQLHSTCLTLRPTINKPNENTCNFTKKWNKFCLQEWSVEIPNCASPAYWMAP